MERITSDPQALKQAAETEVKQFELAMAENIFASFSAFPSIAGFPHSIALIRDANGKLTSRFRQWDTAYNMQQWKTGVYNLDRLRIITDQKMLTHDEQSTVTHLLKTLKNLALPQTLHNSKGITLDGCDWELHLDFESLQVDYRWRAATEDIQLFVPLIDFMRSQHAAVNFHH